MDISRSKVKYQTLLDQIYSEEGKRQHIIFSGDRTLEPNLKVVSNTLDEYYFLYKLNLYCAYLSYKNIVHEKHIPYQNSDFLLIPAIIQLVEEQKLKHPVILIYNKIRKLLESLGKEEDRQETQLRDCIKDIKSYQSSGDTEECIEMYSILNNYCIKRINQGFLGYKIFLWELNHNIIQLQYIEDNRIDIDPNLFRNLVVVAISLRDHPIFSGLQTYGLSRVHNGIEWAEQFIAIHSENLKNSTLGSIHLQYCKAYLEFERGNFARSYKIFDNRMRVQNTFINLSMKALHLKILYEVNIQKAKVLEYDKIEIRQVLDTFRKLIKHEEYSRQTLSYQLPIYIDFLAKYRKLLHFFYRYYAQVNNQKKPNFIRKKQELEQFIKASKQAHNDWFLKKLLEIK